MELWKAKISLREDVSQDDELKYYQIVYSDTIQIKFTKHGDKWFEVDNVPRLKGKKYRSIKNVKFSIDFWIKQASEKLNIELAISQPQVKKLNRKDELNQ